MSTPFEELGLRAWADPDEIRSAYRSLRNNLPHLFVFERWRELGIPNTTNALDGQFSDLKNKLRNHNGLSTTRKTKLIDEYFSA